MKFRHRWFDTVESAHLGWLRMGRAAVDSTADASGTRAPAPANPSRRFRLTRGHLIVGVLVIVGFWVVLSFGRTITQLNTATDREQQLSDETTALAAELEASHRELALVQTQGFQALQARAFGIGKPGEVNFSLQPGAPSPEPVVPLGSQNNRPAPQTPLDAWLRLLFDD
jgi:hypothetical protein